MTARRRRALWAALAAAGLAGGFLAAGCAGRPGADPGSNASAGLSSSASPAPAGAGSPSGWASPSAEPSTPAPPSRSAPPAEAIRLVAAMTLEDKAGLVMMAPVLASDSPPAVAQLVRDHRPGGLLLLGDGWDSAAKVQATVEAAQAAAGGGLWIAADQEGGRVQRLKGSGFDVIASAVELGRLGLDELESRAAVWGAQLAAAGVNLDLAPVVDSVDAAARAANRPIGALDRDFGLDPAGDAAHAAAFIRGLASAGVGSAVKHFPGLGRVAGNTDFTDQGVEDAVTEAGDPAVEAFATALAAGPTMVMVSLATYTRLDPAAPAAFSPAVVTDLLRGQLGWDGVVVSDSLTAAAAQSVAPADRAVKLIQAGGDLATFGDQTAVAPAIAGLIAAAKADQSLAAALDASARRLIAAKLRAGLIDANP